MAIRYDQQTKDEVVAFIQKYNEEHGRGGQTAAVNKWKLNPVTVKSWLEKAGVDSPGRGGRKKAAGKPGRPRKEAQATESAPRGRKPGRKAAAVAGDELAGILNRMMEIRSEIVRLEDEYEKLKNSL